MIMRWSRILLRTLRHRPEGELPGLGFLLQGGFVQRVAAGIYDWGVLGEQVVQRVVRHIRKRAASLDIFTYLFAAVRPRAEGTAPLPLPHYLAPLLHHARSALTSYKHLPRHMMTVGSVYREESRPRAGLFRSRVFTLVEGLSLAHTAQDAHKGYERWLSLWQDVLKLARLPIIPARGTDILGEESTVYIWPHDVADTAYLHCPRCNIWVHPDIAPFRTRVPEASPEPLTKVFTPGCSTIDALCEYLGISPERTGKALFLVAGELVPMIIMVRGDMEVSEVKLRRLLGPTSLRPALSEEIRQWGAEPGYGSPIGTKGALIIVDTVAALTPNLVGGANEEGYHFLNINVGRDFRPHIVADIARAPEEARCPTCGTVYQVLPAWKLAGVTRPFLRRGLLVPAPDFKPELENLPTPYPLPSYLGPDGRPQHPWFVHAVLGVERLVAAVAEAHHDEKGLRWPLNVAPYSVHLVLLPSRKEAQVAEIAGTLYERLWNAGISVFLDDRDERAGVKFNDADLLGAPIRLTVSVRTLRQNGVEYTLRGGPPRLIPLDRVVDEVKQALEMEGEE